MGAKQHSLNGAQNSPRDEGAPARIIEAATKLFAAHGYDGTSTKKICATARVNIAAIHYHFGSKGALYRYIIEAFGGSRVQAVERILQNPESLEEMKLRLELFLAQALDVFIEQPEAFRLVQVEVELLHTRSEDVFRGTFMKLFRHLASFLAYAKKRRLLSKDVDPELAAHFLFNQLRSATRADAVNSKYFGVSIRDDEYRSLWISQVVHIFLNGVRAREATRSK